jgi:membrane-bound metal-dependent hydrolase YbcI (DUF457 family)
MPDLLVHGVLGYLIVTLKPTRYVLASIFLLGCIFPDMIRGPVLVLTNLQHSIGVKIISPDLIIALQVLHSPIPLFLQAWLVCLFFERDIRSRVFVSLLLGILLHLILDAGQRAYQISYLWLFPFSFDNPIAGIWWSDDGIWLTVAAGVVAGVLLMQRHLNARA